MARPVSTLISVAVFAVALAASALAFAETADKALLACQSTKPNVSIAGCTEVIERGEAETVRNRADAFYNRGNAFLAKGDAAKSVADYGEAIALDPDFANAHFNLANHYANTGDHDHAIAEYSEVVRIDPTQKFAFFNRGNSYFAKADLKDAIADYSSVLALDATYVNALINRGNAERDSGAYDLAFADYDAALKLDPKNKLAAGNRHQAEAAQEKEKEKETRAAKLAPPADKAGASDTAAAPAKASSPAGTAAAAADTPPPDKAAPAVAALPPAGSSPETRIALVIGNSDYASVAKLPNPVKDADTIASALRADGFTSVIVVDDVTRSRFLEVLNGFADKAATADWAVVYFAGHGIEIDGTNYLIPIDAALKTDRSVEDEAVSLDRVVKAVELARKLRLVILDACRDNPFVPEMRMTSASRAIHRGLARIEPEGGTLVAYAAKGGEEAIDGDGANSPFAGALAKRLATPGLEVGKLFRLVRDDVLAETGQKQEPFVYGSLPGEDLFFRPN